MDELEIANRIADVHDAAKQGDLAKWRRLELALLYAVMWDIAEGRVNDPRRAAKLVMNMQRIGITGRVGD